jgi:hypothetical protein
MSVWKSVAQNVGSIAKQAAQAVVQEPVEIVKNAIGVGDTADGGHDNQAMEALEQASPTATQSGGQGTQGNNDNNPMGFKTQDDFMKYQQLSHNKDEMELAMLRKQLFRENALDVNVESGMERARQEYQQKEEQRKKVEENKEEEKKMMDLQVKKQEDIALKQATESSSAENKAWGAG